jgi:hypothetical protein
MDKMVFPGPWLKYGPEIGLLALTAWILRRLGIGWLPRWAQRTESTRNHQLVAALERRVCLAIRRPLWASSRATKSPR